MTDFTSAEILEIATITRKLEDGNMQGIDLSQADLYGAFLRGANLRDANLTGTNLIRANLTAVDLRGANLRGADLSGGNLYKANLQDADLTNTNLHGNKYDAFTIWPEGFDPIAEGAVFVIESDVIMPREVLWNLAHQNPAAL